jgi:hypothetical protein
VNLGFFVDPAIYTPLWNAIFTTIGSAANLGFIILTALIGIHVFKFVIHNFF